MVKLTRVKQKIFGVNATATEIAQFGSLAASAPVLTADCSTIQALPAFEGGWNDAIVGNNSPAIEDVNAIDYLTTRQLAYVFEAGVPEWDATTTYYAGSIVKATDGSGSMYRSLTDNNLNIALSDTVNWAAAGGSGSGAGAADTISLLRAADMSGIALLDISGNSSTTFDGGGVITSNFAFSTTTADLLLSTAPTPRVIKYSPGANGQYDYKGYTLTIPQAYRGRVLGFSFLYKNGSVAADNDFRSCIKIVDGASAGTIQYDNLPAKIPVTTEGNTFSTSIYIPSDCTQVKLGWQNMVTTTTVKLFVDNMVFTASPFIATNIGNISQNIRLDTHAGYGSSSTKIPYYTNATANVGPQILTVSNSAVTGLTFTATKKCLVNFSADFKADMYFGWSLNSTQLTTDIQSATIGTVLAWEYQNNTISNVGGSIILNAGDVLRPHAQAVAFTFGVIQVTATAEGDHIITPAKSGIEEVYYDGYTSVSTYTKLKTLQRNTLSQLASVDNTTYTKYTVLKKVIAFVNGNGSGAAAATDVIVYHFNSTGTKIGESNSTTNTAGYYESSSYVGVANPGDYFVSSIGNKDTTQTKFSATFVDFNQQVLSALPSIPTCYIKDVKAYNVDGGTSSADTVHTRTLNTLNETNSDTNGTCSFATLSGTTQFILQPGKYFIDYSAPSYYVGRNFSMLYNITTASITSLGEAAMSINAAGSSMVYSSGRASVSLAVPTTYEIRHYTTLGEATDGLGIAHDKSGYNSIFTQVKVIKIW